MSSERDDEASRVRAAEAALPSAQEQAHRHPQGEYSAEQPFWAAVTGAKYLTADWSDRKVRSAAVHSSCPAC